MKSGRGFYLLLGLFLMLAGSTILLLCSYGQSGVDFIRFGEHLGVAFFVLGGIELLLHLPAMSGHFLGLLRDSIIKDEYLARLDPKSLENLIRRAHQARANEPPERRGIRSDFLDFYFLHLERYMAEPYREDTHCLIVVNEAPEYPDLFQVSMTVSYRCRTGKDGKVQETVDWGVTTLEAVLDIDELTPKVEILLKRPSRDDSKPIEEYLHEVRPEYCYQAPDKPQRWTKKREPRSKESLLEFRLNQPLERYHPLDRLEVRVQAIYWAKKESYQTWRMGYPTRGFTMALDYPSSYEAQVTSFLSGAEITRPPVKGSYTVNFKDRWALPGSGLSWYLAPQALDGHQESQAIGTAG